MIYAAIVLSVLLSVPTQILGFGQRKLSSYILPHLVLNYYSYIFPFHMLIFHQVIGLLRTPNFHMLNGRIETENKYALLITCCPELHAHFLNLLWIECYYMRTVLFLIMLMKSNVNHILNLDSNMLPKRQNIEM